MFLLKVTGGHVETPQQPRRIANDPKEGVMAEQNPSEQSLHGGNEFWGILRVRADRAGFGRETQGCCVRAPTFA
jgi:hypothetical protein